MVMHQEPNAVNKETHHLAAAQRPRASPAAKKSKEPPKLPQDPDAVFPCKKCGRYGEKCKTLTCFWKCSFFAEGECFYCFAGSSVSLCLGGFSSTFEVIMLCPHHTQCLL